METTGTAKEALSIVTDNKTLAAIIDYRLPDKNGFDLFLELRKLNPKIMGILITSYGSKELQEKALELGFHAYFDKPFQNEALITSLQVGLKKQKKTHSSPRESRERTEDASFL